MYEHHVQVLEYGCLCSLQLCRPAVLVSRHLVRSAGLQVTKQHHQALHQRKQRLSTTPRLKGITVNQDTPGKAARVQMKWLLV